MARIITDFEQQTDEWRAAKLGMFSGSGFHVFLGDSKTKNEKLWEKVAERRFLDSDDEDFFSPYTERGNMLEPEARRMYSAINEVDVKEVGLVEAEGEFDGYAVCSPDGLVGEDGIIEIKTLCAKFFLSYTAIDEKTGKPKNYIRPEHRTQCQYNMLITERQWCDLVYYHSRAGVYVIRLERDEEYIERIKAALREGIAFIEEHS
jgi:hypothetical protein